MRARLIAALFLASSACGGDPCAQKSPCQNDTPFTPADISQCDMAIADGAKCAKESKALLECINSNSRCTAGGVTDGTKLSMDCKAQYDAKNACVLASPDGGNP
ncbi:MAG: hypothetical protein QM723_35625 [Myxococcaceae bacterium]